MPDLKNKHLTLSVGNHKKHSMSRTNVRDKEKVFFSRPFSVLSYVIC